MAIPTRAELEQHTAKIADADKKADLIRRFDEASAKLKAAEDPVERATLETELQTIVTEARTAAAHSSSGGGGGGGGGGGAGGGGNKGGGFLTNHAYWLVVLLVVLSFGFLFWYFDKLGPEGFSSIGSIRPLLVLTLIVSMLAFGGLLIIRALFSPYDGDELQNRFRLAREIFLVFSGIFGTIIGFYFGSDDDRPGGALSVEIGFAEGQVTGAVAGGTGPFIGILTLAGQTGGVLMNVDDRVLTHKPANGLCPEAATVSVVDGRGRRAEGKVDCDGGDDGDGSNASDNNSSVGGPVPADAGDNASANNQQGT